MSLAGGSMSDVRGWGSNVWCPKGGRAWTRGVHVWCSGAGAGAGGLYSEGQYIMVMVTWGTPSGRQLTDTHAWKHYLPATPLVDGNKAFQSNTNNQHTNRMGCILNRVEQIQGRGVPVQWGPSWTTLNMSQWGVPVQWGPGKTYLGGQGQGDPYNGNWDHLLTEWRTHTTENVTFPQLSPQAVKI